MDDLFDAHNLSMLITFFSYIPINVKCEDPEDFKINFWTFDRELQKKFNRIRFESPVSIPKNYLNRLNIMNPVI
ncbi:MAG: hypothetical protein JRN26_02930 [Nitrososphaerota archaeon]|jgi:hypothetical protein|nr:hypothetical protein [Nitrososphaerota archaeon]MDG6931768.1 hypothetical protein [Nitrososphaerota archaeon]MDG6935829.1 hypothetical protein [Nitrososphaerota archaeon]MDG6944596.1 hypothetical protein [Nitrososphaerota archaeon]